MRDSELLEIYNEYLSYNSETGIITWIKKSSKNVIIGRIAGTPHRMGYQAIQVRGNLRLSHRVAFLMYHGYLPKYVDHINGNKIDNRISNLRSCTVSQNGFNRPAPPSNTSGYKGVGKCGDKWRSRLVFEGKEYSFGTYDCKHEAAKAYNIGALKHHGEFAYLNIIKGE